MNTLMQEAMGHLFFWSSMGCLPLTIVLAVVGFKTESKKYAALCFVLGVIAGTHFFWYFDMLGGSLTTTSGAYKSPAWYLFFRWPLVVFSLLMFLRIALHGRCKKKSAPPPPFQ